MASGRALGQRFEAPLVAVKGRRDSTVRILRHLCTENSPAIWVRVKHIGPTKTLNRCTKCVLRWPRSFGNGVDSTGIPLASKTAQNHKDYPDSPRNEVTSDELLGTQGI